MPVALQVLCLLLAPQAAYSQVTFGTPAPVQTQISYVYATTTTDPDDKVCPPLMLEWEIGWLGWVFGIFFFFSTIYYFAQAVYPEDAHDFGPGFLKRMYQMRRYQSGWTHLRLIFGNLNFWYGMYGPLALPWGGPALTPESVFGWNCLFYLLPVFIVNMLPIITKLFHCCYECTCGAVGRGRSDGLKTGDDRTDKINMGNKKQLGRVERAPDGSYWVRLKNSNDTRPVRLKGLPPNFQEGDEILVDVNYVSEKITEYTEPEADLATFQGQGSCFDKIDWRNCDCSLFWEGVLRPELWVKPLEVWSALYALKFLPKSVCNPLVLLDEERTALEWSWWIDVIEFALTFFDIGQAAIRAQNSWEGQDDRDVALADAGGRPSEGRRQYDKLPDFQSGLDPRERIATPASPFGSAASNAPANNQGGYLSSFFQPAPRHP